MQYMENFQPGRIYRETDPRPDIGDRTLRGERFKFDTPAVGREMDPIKGDKGEHPGTLQIDPSQPEYWRNRLKPFLKYTG